MELIEPRQQLPENFKGSGEKSFGAALLVDLEGAETRRHFRRFKEQRSQSFARDRVFVGDGRVAEPLEHLVFGMREESPSHRSKDGSVQRG